MDEEDDPIVEEIPVYISNGLSDSLYLLQYPIKNDVNNFEHAHVVNCCVRPHHEHVKVDFAVSTKSKNYDAFRGDRLAQEADGHSQQPKQGRGDHSNAAAERNRPTFPSGRMDKLSYTSSKPSTNVNRYVIGELHDREVHCTPLRSVLQMRPSFSYFDKKDNRDKADQKAGKAGTAAAGTVTSDTDDEDLRQVTVKFQSNDRIRKMHEQSYEHFVAKAAEEPWCETMWYASHTPQAELERRRLYCNRTDAIGYTLGLSSSEYLKALIPPERKEISIDSIVPSKVVHQSKLRSLSLLEQIKNILIDAKIVDFELLVSLLDKRHSRDKILQCVPTVGVMVRGNWVIQSDFLYPENAFSSINGVPALLMCRARDYILFQFTKKTSVNRQKLTEVTQLPAEEVVEILRGIAILNNKEREWELALPTDRIFEQKHTDLVQRQELLWRSKEEMFLKMETEKPTIGKRARKRSIRESKPTLMGQEK